MNEEFTTKEFYEVVYSKYEQIFVNGLTPTGIDDTIDDLFTLTIQQPDNGAEIIVTTLDDGVEHTSTIEDMYFRRAYIVKFKNNDGKGLYLNDLGGLIEQDRIIKAIDPAEMQNRSAIILLQNPDQTIYSSIEDDQFTLTESYFVDKGTKCNFCVIPDDPSLYKPGILNVTELTADEDVYYIYATLPLPIDDRLNSEDYYIIDCGHSITTVNEISNPEENAVTYYDNTEYVEVYIDKGGPYNGIGVDHNWDIEESSRYGKMIPSSKEYQIFDRWNVDDNWSAFSFYEPFFNFDKAKEKPYPCTNFSSVEVNIIDSDGLKTPLFDIPISELYSGGEVQAPEDFAGCAIMNVEYSGRYSPWEDIFNKYLNQWLLVEIHFRDWKKPVEYTEKDDDLILRQDDLFLIECGDSDDVIVSEDDLKGKDIIDDTDDEYIFDGVYGPIPDSNGEVDLTGYASKYVNNYTNTTELPEGNKKYLKEVFTTGKWKVINMNTAFYNCKSLTSLDVSNWDVSHVTDMWAAFGYCQKITSLDVSNWDVSNVTDMYAIFFYLSSVTNLNISNWNTNKVTTMNRMFDYCDSLENLDISNLDTSNVTDMAYMFAHLKISNLDVSDLYTGKVTNMEGMFSDSAILSIDISNWDTSKVTNMYQMFSQCTSLTTVIGTLNMSKVSKYDNMLLGTYNLNSIKIKLPSGISQSVFISNSNVSNSSSITFA